MVLGLRFNAIRSGIYRRGALQYAR